MNIAARLTEALKPDNAIAITRAVAEEVGCSEWIPDFNACNRPDGCFCRDAAERVAKIVSR
jgi:class 3 adenylate cyclase